MRFSELTMEEGKWGTIAVAPHSTCVYLIINIEFCYARLHFIQRYNFLKVNIHST